MLIPLIGALVAGSGGLGLFVYQAVERDLIASIDDELNRVLTGSIGQAVGRGDPLRGDPGGGADRQPGDLVFALFAPKGSGVEHLKALALVSRTLRNAALCAKLRANPEPAKLYALLTTDHSIQAA